jgi:hypothetical protein
MIRVTLELISARTGETSHLGTIVIANDGESPDPSIGHYNACLSKRGQPKKQWRAGSIRGFPRLRLGPYDLLYRVLHATVGDRNKLAK